MGETNQSKIPTISNSIQSISDSLCEKIPFVGQEIVEGSVADHPKTVSHDHSLDVCPRDGLLHLVNELGAGHHHLGLTVGQLSPNLT